MKRGNKLEIFENFEIDYGLPKHQKGAESSVNFNVTVGGVMDSTWSVGIGDDDSNEKLSIGERIGNFFRGFGGIFLTIFKKKPISIREFFMKFSGQFGELSQVANIGQHYEKAIAQAQSLNQTAMVERLKDQLQVVKGEAYLIAMRLTKYVSEEQVIKFYEETDENKHLKLTYLKNYVKMIPSDIVEIKTKLDKKGVFDNYVILHYDPYNEAVQQTKKEIEKEKDPIMFGVIENSRKLYYVGDWIDEVCDLTLEKMMNELGDEALEINNKTLKTYIDQSV